MLMFFCHQRPILGTAYSGAGLKSWAYRYNQPNPTSSDTTTVAHAAENWMMFLGTNTGYVRRSHDHDIQTLP